MKLLSDEVSHCLMRHLSDEFGYYVLIPPLMDFNETQ